MIWGWMTVSISKVTQGLLRVTQAGVAAPLKYGQYRLLGHVTPKLALVYPKRGDKGLPVGRERRYNGGWMHNFAVILVYESTWSSTVPRNDRRSHFRRFWLDADDLGCADPTAAKYLAWNWKVKMVGVFALRREGYVNDRTSDGKFVWTFSLAGVRNAAVFDLPQRDSIGKMYICIFVQMGVRWDPAFV